MPRIAARPEAAQAGYPVGHDPETNLVWWGTANPAPLYDWSEPDWETGGARPGINLYTTSVTGRRICWKTWRKARSPPPSPPHRLLRPCHPGSGIRYFPAFKSGPELRWLVAVGLRNADPALVEAVNEALAWLAAEGKLREIYSRSRVQYRPRPRMSYRAFENRFTLGPSPPPLSRRGRRAIRGENGLSPIFRMLTKTPFRACP